MCSSSIVFRLAAIFMLNQGFTELEREVTSNKIVLVELQEQVKRH